MGGEKVIKGRWGETGGEGGKLRWGRRLRGGKR